MGTSGDLVMGKPTLPRRRRDTGFPNWPITVKSL